MERNARNIQMEVMYKFMESNKSFARGELTSKLMNTMWDKLKVKLDEISNGDKRTVSEWKRVNKPKY